MLEEVTEEQRELLTHAQRIDVSLRAAEERAAALRSMRTESMRTLHTAGVSWAEIARTFSVTPQAAMYATGHAQRQVRPRTKKNAEVAV